MTTSRNFFVLLALFTSVFCASVTEINASPRTASSCSFTDVSTAIVAALRGDTVIVPAGSCTWSSTLTITKGITLQGAGIDQTNITHSLSSFAISYSPDVTAIANNEAFKLSGFTFNGNNKSYSMVRIDNSSTTKEISNITIANNKFKNIFGGMAAIRNNGQVYGAVYSNQFDRVSTVISGFGNDQYSWANFGSFSYGSVNNLFFEDNTISFSSSQSDPSWLGWVETGQGFRGIVVRYNTWNGTNTTGGEFWDIHGLQSRPNCSEYSTQVVEYYGNIITNTSAYRLQNQRGSWMMMFNNVVSGSSSPGIDEQEYACNNCAVNGVYSQHIQNSYIWNNFINSARENAAVTLDYCATDGGTPTTENTHFFNYNASCTASSCISGVGAGAATPTGTCTSGTGYWKTSYSTPGSPPTNMTDLKTYTQGGTFYKCTSTDTWTAYYTPYPYPHPLRSGNLRRPQCSSYKADILNEHGLS